MRVDDSAGKTLRFDNMSTPVDRSVSGTTGWTQYELVLDVPPEATTICLGFLLAGTGTVWGDDLQVEILDAGHHPGPGSAGAGAAPLLPAWASAGYTRQPGRTAGTAGDGAGDAPTAQELFFGRDDEQREFRDLLAELARAPKKAPVGWSHVVIVHGIGGIGKSTLAARFRRIAAEGDGRDRYTVVNVDWADVREDPAFVAQPAPSFEAVLEKLEQECSRTGKLARHFEQFRRLLLRIAKVKADVDRMGGGPADSQPGTVVGRSADAIGSVLRTVEVFGVPPGPGEALQIAGKAADAASALWKSRESWLRGRLDPDDYQMYFHPQEVLASAFAKGLAAASAGSPIVLLLDTCEVVTAAGRSLRAVMRESGPRVAWVLCGRFEADPAGWPDDFDLSDGYLPGGRLSELNAYRKEVPGSRLRLFELGAFDAGTLSSYLSKAAPQRPVDEEQLGRLLAATAGIPLAVRLAASLWRRGIAIDTITDPVPVGADRRTVVDGMTERFFLHFSTDAISRSDRDRIYGLALVLHPEDADLIAALWNTDHAVEVFESLARRHDFVLAGQFRLHDAVKAFLLRYLLDPFRRRGVRPLNQRAVALLEQRLGSHHQQLPTLEQRMRSERWTSDLLALVWHRFWIDDQDGWATVLAAFPAAIAYNREAGRAMLDLAGRFIPSSAADGQRRLRLLRDTLGPIAALFDRAGADSLSEMGGSSHRASVEPDAGCGDERTAIMDWLNGQRALHNDELAAALQHLTAAAEHAPPSAQQLRRWVGRSLLTVSGRFTADLSVVIPPDTETEPYAAAASLAARLDPDNPYTQRQCGSILRYLGRNEDALAAFGAAIELGDHGADAYLGRAVILNALGRHDEALDAANQALRLEPDNARATGIRGDTYRELERYDEAMTDLNDAINRDHEFPWAFISRGEVYRERGDNEKALIDFGRAIDLAPGSASAIASRGRTYRMMGQCEKALDDLNEALRLDPGYAFAIANRGEAHRMMGEYEKAVTDFGRAIDLNPAFAAAIASRGQAYQDMGQYEKAVTDFGRAIDLDPGFVWAIANRGRTYRMMGQYGKALDDLNEALRLDPRLNRAIAERGDTYQMMGRYEEALSDVSHVIGLGEETSSVFTMRGSVYRDMRRFDEALADFSHVIDLDPDDRAVFVHRAMAYRLMGRHDEALADLNKVIESYPDSGWALTVRGRNYSEMGRYAEALADLSRAARLDPEEAWPQFELAIVYLRLERPDPALAALSKTIDLGTGRITSCGVTLPRLYSLALFHAALGNAKQARDFWVQALALPCAATYVRCAVIPELSRLQAAIPDSNKFDELLRLLATHGPDV